MYGKYAEVKNEIALHYALQLCRGSYQRAILTGREAISGATLRGKAKRYGDRYARSAIAIIARCQQNGLPVREEIQDHNRRTIVIG